MQRPSDVPTRPFQVRYQLYRPAPLHQRPLFPKTLLARASILALALGDMRPALTAWLARAFALAAWLLSGTGYERPGPANVEDGNALRALVVSLAIELLPIQKGDSDRLLTRIAVTIAVSAAGYVRAFPLDNPTKLGLDARDGSRRFRLISIEHCIPGEIVGQVGVIRPVSDVEHRDHPLAIYSPRKLMVSLLDEAAEQIR